MRPTILLAILLISAGCRRHKAAQGNVSVGTSLTAVGPDTWKEHPPVHCPTSQFCDLWTLPDQFSGSASQGTLCVKEPRNPKTSGRVIAVDPNDSHVVLVDLTGGCS